MFASLKKSLVLSLSCALLLGAAAANAEIVPGRPPIGGGGYNGGNTEERVRGLEARVGQLEANLSQLNQRLSALERPAPYPAPVQPIEQACMITDSLMSKVTLGKGRTRLEAEANARQACSSGIAATYCNTAAKCTDPQREAQVRQGVMCVLVDTLMSRTYKADAKSFLDAEYQARKSCQDSIAATYCKADVRCEAY